MVRVASLFTQVLSLIFRSDFARAVRRRDAKKGAKGFSCWDQPGFPGWPSADDRRPAFLTSLSRIGRAESLFSARRTAYRALFGRG